jgi:hypothetical protein
MALNKALMLSYAEAADWQIVESSNVNAVAYVEDFGYLFVEFKAQKNRPAALYVYYKVPRSVYDGFLSAASKGRYVYDVIRSQGTDSFFGYDRVY